MPGTSWCWPRVRPEETDRNHPATRLRVELARLGTSDRDSAAAVERFGNGGRLARQIAGREIAAGGCGGSLIGRRRGNPLFVVESVRYGRGCVNPTANAAIHAVIARELAQLSPIGI